MGIAFDLHTYKAGSSESWGLEAAERLGLSTERVSKTLVAQLDARDLAVAIIPVAARLDLKALAQAAGSKKADLAPPQAAQRATGYVLGGISPLGQKTPLRAFVDETLTLHETVFVSGGRRGLEIELSPQDLISLIGGIEAPLAR